MKASMVSARTKRLVALKSVDGNPRHSPNLRKTHRKRMKTMKQRRKTNQVMREQRLTSRFQLKMSSKGINVSDKDLKKFLKHQTKKKKKSQQFLTPNEVEKLSTFSSGKKY